MSKQTVYELTILVRATLEEAERKAVIDAVQAMVTLDETEENKLAVTHWGRRQMAYLIDDQKEAYYVLFTGPMDSRAIREYDRSLMYNENILRHLFIRKEA